MKKTYKKPELKQVELKRRACLLDASAPEIGGEIAYYQTFGKDIAPRA